MLSKAESAKKTGESSGAKRFLNDIHAMSKGLNLDKAPSRNSRTRSSSTGKTPQMVESKSRLNRNQDQLPKEKKSIWNWPLRAFANDRNRRFNCCFSLDVHTIEGLPPGFDNLSLSVHWKRRDACLTTRRQKVLNGKVEFEENLTHTCSVYGTRSGPHHSAKYEAKHFLLYVAVFGVPEIDLGKHRVDLTRLLPLTLEELEEEKSSGKWTTSYRLTGKAKGANLNVSFRYTVIGDHAAPADHKIPQFLNRRQNRPGNTKPVAQSGSQDNGKTMIERAESLPNNMNLQEEVKDLHEVFPGSKLDLTSSLNLLYKKLDEEKRDPTDDSKTQSDELDQHLDPVKPEPSPLSGLSVENTVGVCANHESCIDEKGPPKQEEVVISASDTSFVEVPKFVEVDSIEQVTFEEKINGDVGVENRDSEDEGRDSKAVLMEELELALKNVSNLEMAALDSPEDQEECTEVETDNEINQEQTSTSLDDVTDSVASEFLDMLGIEHSPFGISSDSEAESPRERLLRQFEKETLACGGSSIFDFGVDDDADDDVHQAEYDYDGNLDEEFDLSSLIEAAEEEYQMETQGMGFRPKAKVLEDLETEVLMREWGMNEKSFQYSPPPHTSNNCFVQADLLSEEPLEIPPLGEGLGPFLQTKNGGYLRSMNPSVFRESKTDGSLVMQVSNPVVVPAEMGSGVMEILQKLASVGIEKLSMQASKLMPLDDITGKTMQQVAWEAAPALEGPKRQNELQQELDIGKQDTYVCVNKARGRSSGSKSRTSSSISASDMGSEYVSLEDLAPLAMDKIEALSLEGLRIESGMSDEDAPSNITAHSTGKILGFRGKEVNIGGLEGAAGLQLLDIKDNGDDVDGLMGLSLTLDEWMKLDSGELDDDEDQISERTSRILAAHHGSSLDVIRRSKGEKRKGKGSSRRCGLLGNNFTVALMVQLHDPIRNYEPVGGPMLALIQVERVFLPPKPKIYSTVSELRKNSEDEDDVLSESVVIKNEIKEEIALEELVIPQYKITEVHVAGLKTQAQPGKKKLWGTAAQQQSGSRWCIANGMGKSNKHPLMKSKPASKSTTPSTTKVQPGDTLWSISARVYGTGAKWKELAALNPHIRNPNVILTSQTVKLC